MAISVDKDVCSGVHEEAGTYEVGPLSSAGSYLGGTDLDSNVSGKIVFSEAVDIQDGWVASNHRERLSAGIGAKRLRAWPRK